MIDGMFQEGTDAALDDQVRRPRSVVLKPPFSLKETTAAAFQGIGGGVAKSIAFGAELSGAFGQVAGAYPEMFGGQLSQQQRMESETARQKLYTQGVDYSNEAGDIFRARAKDILPDAQTAHASAQVVAGLTDFATRAVGYAVTLGPLAPAAMGGDAGLEESDRLKQQGVDLETRTKAGAVAGVLNAAAVAIPMTGATALTRFGKGVAVGESTIVGQSLAEQHILRAAGYDKIADSFDPLDPVALAMGVVPGALGAKFGRPKVRTEADVKKYAALTPEEQARSDAYERSPTNIAELERAIKDEKRPEVRALLEAEHAKQSRAQAEHGVSEAVKAEPDLVPAARVAQVVDALDSTRLTPDADMAGRDAHLSAVELAGDQMGRGDEVAVAGRFGDTMLEPPLEAGMVRMYHGSAEHGRYDGKAWFSSDRAYAENYRQGAELQYVDMPRDRINAIADPDGYGQTVEKGFTVNAEFDSAETGPRRPMQSDRPRQTADAAEQLRAARTPPEPKAKREPAPKEPKAGKAGQQEAPAKPQKPPAQPASADAEGVAPSAVSSAAEAAAALDPEMLVHLDGMDAPMRVGDLLAKVKEEAANDVRDAKLLEVAAACDLSS